MVNWGIAFFLFSRSVNNYIMKYTAIIEKTNDECYIAHCAQVPGANSQGRTFEEAQNNLREAISLILESEKELAMAQVKNKNVFYSEIAFA